jgi:hypothetical protein
MTIKEKTKRWIEDFKNRIAPIMPDDYDDWDNSLTRKSQNEYMYREDMGMGERDHFIGEKNYKTN